MTDLELPEEPTFGFITSAYYGYTQFGTFCTNSNEVENGRTAVDQPSISEVDISGDKTNQWYRVTSFTPAAAIPAPMLNKLRDVWYQNGDNYWTGPLSDAVRELIKALEGTSNK